MTAKPETKTGHLKALLVFAGISGVSLLILACTLIWLATQVSEFKSFINKGNQILETQKALEDLVTRVSQQSGSVYIRWGRTTCGNKSELIYEGIAGGGYFTNTGGGVNYQCLPLEPEWNSYDSETYYHSTIYGVEYQPSNSRIFPNSFTNQNVPCAACLAQKRSSILMIPAKRNCPVDWTMEYEGYLMSSRDTHAHPSTFECVDSNPEYISNQNNDTQGALLYFVRSNCKNDGTLGHCPPYYDGRQLTCVVCSR